VPSGLRGNGRLKVREAKNGQTFHKGVKLRTMKKGKMIRVSRGGGSLFEEASRQMFRPDPFSPGDIRGVKGGPRKKKQTKAIVQLT